MISIGNRMVPSDGNNPLNRDNPFNREAPLNREIARALLQWKAATAYYENAQDADLVDYAIFEMEAAKRRYTYLLKLKRDGA